MKKSLLPVWVILFSTAAIALLSAQVRSDDTLTPLTTGQVSEDASQAADQAASGAQTAAGQTAAASATDTSTPASTDSGGKKGGCCG